MLMQSYGSQHIIHCFSGSIEGETEMAEGRLGIL